MMKSRTRRALVLAGSALALTVALSGCSAINDILGGGPADADRDEETGQVTEGANIDIFALKLGDCKTESSTGELTSADVVPCSEPHAEEVFHEITMPDGEFSDDDVNAASEECYGEAFTTFVGLPYEESVLDTVQIVPTQETWDELNDRVVQCLIVEEGGQTVGSLKGVAR